ncbi:MAG: hypothetical protein COT43_07435 [Candidatus Marinimicrobia bacterium CG08_land_8_20_14_0_20_45_22]|nr:MAG: hypothetical protein COT43_07435 [Candidatus Marinimicrobia bacterium CG08_land_8_20_14_0_20_45_22]
MKNNIHRFSVLIVILGFLLCSTAISEKEPEKPIFITDYTETIDIGNDGTANVVVDVQFNRPYKSSLYIPLLFRHVDLVTITPDTTEKENVNRIVSEGGIKYIRIDKAKSAQECQDIKVRFNVPKYYNLSRRLKELNHYPLTQRFINSSQVKIRKYRLQIILPEGFIVHKIVETTPKYIDMKLKIPAYEVQNFYDRSSVVLNAIDLQTGDWASLEIIFNKTTQFRLFMTGIVISLLICFLLIYDIVWLRHRREKDAKVSESDKHMKDGEIV